MAPELNLGWHVQTNPLWRWASGLCVIGKLARAESDGIFRGRVEVPSDGEPGVVIQRGLRAGTYTLGFFRTPPLLDLDDPLTRAWLLELIQAAMPERAVWLMPHSRVDGTVRGWAVCARHVDDGSFAWETLSSGDTKAEALVAGLEAAARMVATTKKEATRSKTSVRSSTRWVVRSLPSFAGCRSSLTSCGPGCSCRPSAGTNQPLCRLVTRACVPLAPRWPASRTPTGSGW